MLPATRTIEFFKSNSFAVNNFKRIAPIDANDPITIACALNFNINTILPQ